ncbi:MAG: outer membrane beta-barrel protein [Bacteroidales bacterium]|nr:outer membrane beta-barrel protein [Bacteroidales bacterium]
MQKKSNTDFDSIIKSMMENAQETPPAGLWQGIESRLPQPGKAPAPWWRWAVPAMALAAASLAAVLFINKPSVTTTYETEQTSVTAQGPSQEGARSSLLALSEQQSQDPAQSQPAVQVLRPSAEPDQVPAEEPSVTETQQPAPQEAVLPQESAEPQTIQEAQSALADTPIVMEYTQNPFYHHEAETRARRAQLQLNGLIGGNEASQTPFSRSFIMGTRAVADPTGTTINENTESTYGIPLSFGLGARFYLSNRFSVGTGLTYSMLVRSFNGTFIDDTRHVSGDVRHSIQYLGIPLNLYYDILDTDLLQLYLFGGGAAEKAISNKYLIQNGSDPINYSTKVPGLQWSADLGLGIQFRLTDHVGLYLDPSARYYFNSNQPKSIRTKKPFMFGFEAGLRFDLK